MDIGMLSVRMRRSVPPPRVGEADMLVRLGPDEARGLRIASPARLAVLRGRA